MNVSVTLSFASAVEAAHALAKLAAEPCPPVTTAPAPAPKAAEPAAKAPAPAPKAPAPAPKAAEPAAKDPAPASGELDEKALREKIRETTVRVGTALQAKLGPEKGRAAVLAVPEKHGFATFLAAPVAKLPALLADLSALAAEHGL